VRDATFLTVNFSDTRVVHGTAGTLPPPRSTRPLTLAMHRPASSRLPVSALLQPAVSCTAPSAAARAAVPLPAVAALADKEPMVAISTELLKERLLVISASTGHVRTADDEKVDDDPTTWQ